MARRKKRPPPSVTVWPLTLSSGRPASAPLSGCEVVFLRQGSIEEDEFASLLGPRLLWGETATLDEMEDNIHWVLIKPGADVAGLLATCRLERDRLYYQAGTGRTHSVHVEPVRVPRPTSKRSRRAPKGVQALLQKLRATDGPLTTSPQQPQTWRLATPAPAPKKRKPSLWVRFVSVPMGGLSRWRRR